MTRDELILSAVPLVWHHVHSLPNLPDGVTPDDLASDGIAAACKCADRFDPNNGTPFGGYANIWIRGAMLDTIEKKRNAKHNRGNRPMDIANTNPETPHDYLPVDPRQSNPADIAAELETLQPGARITARSLAAVLPSPDVVADKVSKLREAMFGALHVNDVTLMMETVMEKAQAGDLKAAKILIDLLAPRPAARPSVSNQNAIVINRGDL